MEGEGIKKLSAVSCQLSAVSYQLSAIRRKYITLVNGKIVNKKFIIGSG